jgi:HJR/Mrr/RecB family endonuclease
MEGLTIIIQAPLYRIVNVEGQGARAITFNNFTSLKKNEKILFAKRFSKLVGFLIVVNSRKVVSAGVAQLVRAWV